MEREDGNRSIKVRATHEITATRTDQFTFVVVQFMAASRAIPPILSLLIADGAGCVFGRLVREGGDVGWVGPGFELEVGSMGDSGAQARMPLTTSP